MPSFSRPPKVVALGLLVLLCVGLSALASRNRFFRTLELKTVDARFRLLGDQGIASQDVVLVAIDDRSVKNLEPLVGRWPWPRDAHAVLLSFLERGGASVVAFDVLFTEADVGYPEGDESFAAATAQAGNVVHSLFLGTQRTGGADRGVGESASIEREGGFDSFVEVEWPVDSLARSASRLGHVSMILDGDGPWRRYLLLAGGEDRLFPSLALATVMAERGAGVDEIRVGDRLVELGETRAPLDEDWRLPIWFGGGANTYPRHSYGDLFLSELQIEEGEEPLIAPDLFRDKIVIVGVSAAGLHDLFTTSWSGGAADTSAELGKMHGFEIHAQVVDNLLANRYLRSLAPAIGWLLVLLMAALTAGLALYTRLSLALVGLAVAPFAYLVAVQSLFRSQQVAPITPVLLAWMLASVFGFAYQYSVESAARREVKRIFSRYVSPAVFSELMDDPEAVALGGRRQDVTVLFSDLRDFTSISERLEPEEILEQLNEYFTEMVEVVFEHRGTVDKFVGDMIMAIFGAPIADPGHPDRAVRCAVAMQQRLVELNERWDREGRPRFRSGVGLHSGEVVVGNLGSEKMQSYTVIGDNVNLGARIESLCKEYSAEILTSGSTFARLEGAYVSAELGEAMVKGKSEPVKIYRIDG